MSTPSRCIEKCSTSSFWHRNREFLSLRRDKFFAIFFSSLDCGISAFILQKYIWLRTSNKYRKYSFYYSENVFLFSREICCSFYSTIPHREANWIETWDVVVHVFCCLFVCCCRLCKVWVRATRKKMLEDLFELKFLRHHTKCKIFKFALDSISIHSSTFLWSCIITL